MNTTMIKTNSQPASCTIGAIRWDGWGKGNVWQANLNPAKWHARLPFYGRILDENQVDVEADSQEVMDQEIAYAHDGALDYWIFLHGWTDGWRSSDKYYGLVHYLASPLKAKINFCSMVLPVQGEGWRKQVEMILELLQEPTYQKVAGERPLVYLLFWDTYGDPERIWGDLDTGSRAVNLLRQEIRAAGFNNPYLVVLSMQVEQAARYARAMGIDAISAYANWSYGTYQDLAARNRLHWEECKMAGSQDAQKLDVVPLVNAGWDPRPRYETEHVRLYGETRDWAETPTPGELAAHLSAALDWLDANPETSPHRTAIIYAWNETDEGSWLLPTLAEGPARLQAIRSMLDSRRQANG
jgi:hypothetical protein